MACFAATGGAVLMAWGSSPYGRYLDHSYQPSGGASEAATLALFVAGWLLMVVAMMLPTATRLVGSFADATRDRPDAMVLQLLVVAGFVLAWVVAGYVFRTVDFGIHATVDAVGWLRERPRMLAGGAFLLAGAFQFSSLKHRCLAACRSPRSFIHRNWHGTAPRREALSIGLSYGKSCVGCCWALMLVVFAVGMANLAWMFALGAIMALEKNAVVGPRMSRAVGAVFAGVGVAVVFGLVASPAGAG